MVTFSRKLKTTEVIRKSRQKNKNFKSPKLILQGNWFASAGFEIGEYLNVKVSKNKIVITK